MSNELPPFYVGQEVVCIETHIRGRVVKGKEYTIHAIMQKCCGWVVDVGIKHDGLFSEDSLCLKCGLRTHGLNKSTYKMCASRFAPKDQFKAITFTKVMETELVSQN